MAENTDFNKTDDSGAITWIAVNAFNAQVKCGNESRNIRIPAGHSTVAANKTAFENVLNLLNPRTKGLIVGVSQKVQINADQDVPAMPVGRMVSETFTFREIRGGAESYVKMTVPFYDVMIDSTLDKATIGTALADELTGDAATYYFVS